LSDYMDGSEAAGLIAEKWEEDFFCSFKSVAVLTEEQAGRWFVSDGEYSVFGPEAESFFASGAVSRSTLEKLRSMSGDQTAGEVGTIPACYAETLAALTAQDCSAALLAGSRENGGYRPDRDRARVQLAGK
ncbi:MAG: hypothetical protein K2N94_13700, partial [Lachnospiraceae bacterium]|nr:hypothetical protein [Lachnospiraceae bacterium]